MHAVFATHCMRWLALSCAAALTGCASTADVYEKHVRAEEANPSDVVLTLDVAFARAPDYAPRTIEYGSTDRRVEYAGYPSLDVPFYQKGWASTWAWSAIRAHCWPCRIRRPPPARHPRN